MGGNTFYRPTAVSLMPTKVAGRKENSVWSWMMSIAILSSSWWNTIQLFMFQNLLSDSVFVSSLCTGYVSRCRQERVQGRMRSQVPGTKDIHGTWFSAMNAFFRFNLEIQRISIFSSLLGFRHKDVWSVGRMRFNELYL